MIRDVKPPLWLINVVNPLTKLELRTPLARVLPWALLHFEGRRSGKPITVVVTWYDLSDGPVVFTPNPWRANFDAAWPVTTRRKNKLQARAATLTREPSAVAAKLNELVDRGVRYPAGLRVPKGQRITAEDVVAADRAMLRFS